jgi:hypothetical protein
MPVKATNALTGKGGILALPAGRRRYHQLNRRRYRTEMTPTGKQLLLAISGLEPATEDLRLLALAEWMGVPAKTVEIGNGDALLQHLADPMTASCLAMSAETLTAMMQGPGSSIQDALDGPFFALFVFGCTDTPEQQRALSALTTGVIAGMHGLSEPAERFSLPSEAASLSGQLAGLSFSGSTEEPVAAFELRAGTAEVILAANERPVFVRLDRGPARIFLLSLPLPDIDKSLSRMHGIEEHYAALIAPLIWLRSYFGDRCWHAPQSTARLIIDDPGLSMRYGSLDYKLLLESMQRCRYGTSVAFIPWNGWRTSRKNVSRLLGEGSNLSICIHGYDHTKREFELADGPRLDAKASLAMRRMEAQQTRTGAAFEPVMVFPQGHFSSRAIKALRTNDYLAAVNTTAFPADHGVDDIRVRDFLRPAITRYDGFPIFLRHYPRSFFDLAFDLFVGKPALVVEHHQFFRGGCEAMEDVVAGMYKADPALRWPSLSDQLMRSCLERTLPDGSEEVLFFTRRFVFENRCGHPEHFLLSKDEPDAEAIQSVLVDGIGSPWTIENGRLKLEVEAQPGQVRRIEIIDREIARPATADLGVAYNTGVLVRRALSEFRDNTLARNERLLKVANGIAKMLKVSGRG